MMSMLKLALINASVCVLYCCVDIPSVEVRAPRMDASGRNQLCEKCGRRLAEVKYTHPQYPGDACHPRCKPKKGAVHQSASPATSSISAVVAPRKRKRAVSDPGQPQNLSRLRTRAPRPVIIPPIEKTRVKADTIDISSLLDQTHARRMALLEAEKTDSHSTSTSTVNASAILW
jgi:hypothetical protein